MSKLVELCKPVLMWLYESAEVKKLVVELLERYSASTDNTVDDLIVATVRKALLPEEAK
ncbi:hypothetical protein BOW86_gp259 [Synechococcus phage S-CAM7]|jgi:hypothetical protein|uniref:Uncharacterized protein n=1 Tax=Synechococcus phage S-CAM7 TaxID=1883368 RepID=A0A1D8KUM2_9CAUD|nr:hypothetical protein BOW86_gp259 [Synechococcus phage S-CAM7]AOV62122.1 hypothetical protein C490910_198 [Synechococcus phage S-CAM7]AOV62385.1 hypothetical protein S420910_197 [Synechococcus phage S-CAM7]QLF86250.1 hypothetical protein CC030809_00202 [Synechococcus phage S-CAM7]